MKFDWQLLWIKVTQLLGAGEFWAAVFACAVAYGLPLKPELQALISLLALSLFSTLRVVKGARGQLR